MNTNRHLSDISHAFSIAYMEGIFNLWKNRTLFMQGFHQH
ncbi:hypothetical protein TPHV1_40174 [Treponema phagedenis]|uniref:Uncharacterized protein n=1 Tax=Treponema phagedenis TaxID=162 RepID=A0A0B7H146_TREPH|nr:hypothetical protein TPHV1_40174 [Treponema phagedenis]